MFLFLSTKSLAIEIYRLCWPLREQARSHRGTHSNVGAGLLAKGPERPKQIQPIKFSQQSPGFSLNLRLNFNHIDSARLDEGLRRLAAVARQALAAKAA
ncbi:hypothetical protein BK665_22005 [Pseudomonas frederiksbergensis]|uniref:Uncharacterized protein n=1 Tax=Pseudomonas frederiksbergensis TaxID=104087 RepID=A0A423KBI3_9PSED|nr:hypothetical protein BK665_22005 [Pseudomonas frederiksbergensis]